MRAITSRSGPLAGATILVWKACETGILVPWNPAALNASRAASTAVVSPPITDCSGLLILAITTYPSTA